jgi:inosose dehydratase
MRQGKIKLGIAPIGWTNDDMPELGSENTFAQCISEMALAGFEGTEIGSKYPKDVDVLKRELKLRNLRICNQWCSTFLITDPYSDTLEHFERQIDFLKEVGASIIGVSEQSYSIQGVDVPIFSKQYAMRESEWEKLTTGLNRLGEIAAKKDIKLAFHHHMGTVIQTAEDVHRLMSDTDPAFVYLLFDSGHLAYCDENLQEIMETYITRIAHVHLKDIRRDVIARVKNERMSFLQGVKMGTFTVPGDGDIDFTHIFKCLDDAGYEGWIVVEAEQDPSVANPLEYAQKARTFIKDNMGL